VNAISSVSEVADGQAAGESPRPATATAHNDVACIGAEDTPRMGVRVAVSRWDPGRANDVFHFKVPNDGVYKASCVSNISEASVEDCIVSRSQGALDLTRLATRITIRQMFEVGIQVHLATPKMAGHAQAELGERGCEAPVRLLEPWMSFLLLRNRHVRKLVRFGIDRAVPGAAAGTLV
jgi:hypothetical protein